MEDLDKDLDVLSGFIRVLDQERFTDPLANDVYEALWDWRQLGVWVVTHNTKVNFSVRAGEEFELLDKLRKLLGKRGDPDQGKYLPMLEAGQRVLYVVEATKPPKDGHLGILKTIQSYFGFLQSDYGFQKVTEEPIGAGFSSGHVFITLEWAKTPSSSCSFGAVSKPQEVFWIDDLLFAYGDGRYRTLPIELSLDTRTDVEDWFRFLAEVFRQYGDHLLSNHPGIFATLTKAQTERDMEYQQAMESASRS